MSATTSGKQQWHIVSATTCSIQFPPMLNGTTLLWSEEVPLPKKERKYKSYIDRKLKKLGR